MSKFESLPENIYFVDDLLTGWLFSHSTFLDTAVSFLKYSLMKARVISDVMNIHVKIRLGKDGGDVTSNNIDKGSNLSFQILKIVSMQLNK